MSFESAYQITTDEPNAFALQWNLWREGFYPSGNGIVAIYTDNTGAKIIFRFAPNNEVVINFNQAALALNEDIGLP